MKQSLGKVSLVVNDYDEALDFFVGVLGFELVVDTPLPQQQKRWVVIAPRGDAACQLLLAKASSEEQRRVVGSQASDRVFLFLHTDDFWRDFESYRSKGVVFTEEPREETYGTVAVFLDLYGNRWDLLEPRNANDAPC